MTVPERGVVGLIPAPVPRVTVSRLESAKMETGASWRGLGPSGRPALWGLRPPGTPTCGFPSLGEADGCQRLPLSCPGQQALRGESALCAAPGLWQMAFLCLDFSLSGFHKRTVKALPLTAAGWPSRQQ